MKYNSILTQKKIRRCLIEYQEASWPFIKIMVDFLNVETPKLIFHPNGNIERKYTAEYYLLKKQIDKALKLLQEQIFRKII